MAYLLIFVFLMLPVPLDLCVGAKLESFRKAEESYNAIINHIPLGNREHDYPPYIGKG